MQTTTTVERAGHSPTLNTIKMVEAAIQANGEPIMLADLKRALPRKVMHSTLLQALDYIQENGKILITTKGIVWTFATREELAKLKKDSIEL